MCRWYWYRASLVFASVALLGACQPGSPIYADDPEDPIPYVTKIDGVVSTNQGLYYLLTIATPLDASYRSLHRLEVKCDNYLNDFQSPQTQADLAKRGAGLKHINVYLHPASSAEARRALAACGIKARAQGVDFQITDKLPESGALPSPPSNNRWRGP